MGTFHDHRGSLHGITVLVDSHGDRAWVGRCDTYTSEGIVLLDGDTYEGRAADEKAGWIQRVAEVGIWKRFDRLVVPSAEIASVRPLSELRPV